MTCGNALFIYLALNAIAFALVVSLCVFLNRIPERDVPPGSSMGE